MATLAKARPGPLRSLAPDRLERGLAVGSALFLAVLMVALLRGRERWGELPPLVWAHLALLAVALALTPVLFLKVRGTRAHRRMGWAWAGAMFGTAALSFAIHQINGGFSVIHLLALFVVLVVPRLVWTARRHRVAQHRRTARGLVIGALLVAGGFTLVGDRILAQFLWS